jgi:hypothetical protein
VTICIGALAANCKAVVCIADKGLSYGPTIQWDSDSTKILRIGSSSVYALISGGELMITRVLRELNSKPKFGEDLPATIKACEESYKKAESEVLEATFLHPYLLDVHDFNAAITRRRINSFMKNLAEQMGKERYEENYTSCGLILCGFDSQKKAFILDLSSPGLVTDFTNTGTRASGSGSEWATARLLWSGWKRDHPIHRVLFEVFDAKANAEMAPTVGTDFDVTILTADGATPLPKGEKDILERAWVKVDRSPFEKHNPDTDLPEPPENWQSQLENYCDKLLSEQSKTKSAGQ